MIEGIYSAISGLEANQTMLDVVSNNLANLNTVGYKDQSVDFSSALSQVLSGAGGPTSQLGGTNPIEVGVGVNVQAIDTNESTGTMESTGNALDVAIEGSGYLQVGDGAPPTLPATIDYTRAGNLTTDANGYLTTDSGQYVVGLAATKSGTSPNFTYAPSATSSYIVIPPGSSNVAVGTDGTVSYTDENSTDATYGQTVVAGYLSLAKFANPEGLNSLGNNVFSASPNSGTPTVAQASTNGVGQLISGELEMSNVDLATEFTNMITAQRGYDANAQVITTANQMLQTLEQATVA
jgi:flagellar hook protein FlgE